MNRKLIMEQWDEWRWQIADGHRGSAPRDWFESILDYYEEKIQESYEKGRKDAFKTWPRKTN